MNKYLILPRIAFRGATAAPVWWAAGCPGPSAALGLANYLALQAGGDALASHLQAVALVIHDFQYRAEHIKGRLFAHQLRASVFIDKDDYASGINLSSQPTIRCDGAVTLALRFASDAAIDTQAIERTLHRARFAGGDIVEHLFTADSTKLYDSQAEALAQLRAGFGFHDRADLLKPVGDERDPLDAFLRATRRAVKKPPTNDGSERPASWLMPYLGGYRRMNEAAQRPMAREGYPCAFAEPLAGLGQLVSLRDAPPPFWSFQHDGDRLYLYRAEGA